MREGPGWNIGSVRGGRAWCETGGQSEPLCPIGREPYSRGHRGRHESAGPVSVRCAFEWSRARGGARPEGRERAAETVSTDRRERESE